MRINFKTSIAKFISCVFLLNIAAYSFADTGTTGGTVFLINPDPVTAAMGDAGTALLSDKVTATALNPAASAGVYRTMASISNTYLMTDVQYNYLGVVFPSEVGNFGISMFNAGYGDIDGYDADGNARSMDSSNDMAFIVNYSVDLTSAIPVSVKHGGFGVNIKVLRSKLADYIAESVAMDLGFAVSVPELEKFSVGAAYKNLGSDLKFAEQKDKLPQIFTLGLAYKEEDWYDLTIAADYATETDANSYWAVGAAVTPVYFLTLRAGLKGEEESLSDIFRCGLGLNFQNLYLDYAYTPSSTLNGAHNFNLSYAFGNFVSQKMAYDHYLTAHFRDAVSAFNSKDFVTSRRMFDEILSVYPDHRPSQQYLQRTLDELEKIDAYQADKVNGYMKKAQAALDKKDAVNASKNYRLALEIDPENSLAKTGLEQVAVLTGEVKAETQRIEHTKRIEFLWDRANYYYKAGDLVRSKTELKKILEVDPSNTSATDKIADIDNQLSKIAADKITELFNTGMQYYNKKEYDDAIRFFEAVVIAAPHRLDVQDMITRAERAIQEITESERATELAKVQNQYRAELMSQFEKGLSAYEKNKLSQALGYFKKAKEIADRYEFKDISASSQTYIQKISYDLSERHYKRGFELYRKNDFEKAAAEYRKAIELNPNNTSAVFELDRVAATVAQRFFERGMDAYAQGDFDKAREYLRKSLYYKPDKVEAKRALERLK